MARPSLATMVVVCLVSALGAGCAHGLKGLAGADDGPGEAAGGDGGAGGSGGEGGGSTESTASASTLTTSSTTWTTSTTTSTSASSVCDSSGSCDSCGNCAINATCQSQTNGCLNDADCTAMLDCLQACADDACANACADAHPSGRVLYMNLMVCVFCDACMNDCQGASSGACQ